MQFLMLQKELRSYLTIWRMASLIELWPHFFLWYVSKYILMLSQYIANLPCLMPMVYPCSAALLCPLSQLHFQHNANASFCRILSTFLAQLMDLLEITQFYTLTPMASSVLQAHYHLRRVILESAHMSNNWLNVLTEKLIILRHQYLLLTFLEWETAPYWETKHSVSIYNAIQLCMLTPCIA